MALRVLARACVVLCLSGVPCEVLEASAAEAGLPADDVMLIKSLAVSRDPIKGPRTLQSAAAAPVAPVPEVPVEDRLSAPASSNLDIGRCGPRAAGKLLLENFAKGVDRMVSTCSCLLFLYVSVT